MTTGDDSVSQTDDAVEQLLSRAEPRPAPSPQASARARASVKIEWLRTNRRRNLRRYAIAASAVLAALAWFSTEMLSPPQPTQLASIDKAIGEIGFLHQDGVVERRNEQTAVIAGETIVTGNNASLGLRWHNGGSLRLDGNTSVHFLEPDQIELRSGRVYFDSGSPNGVPGTLVIHTDYGDLRHLGTQFMADISRSDLLRVSVREGEIAVAGLYHEARVGQGKQLLLHGDRLPIVMNLAAYGTEWQWVQTVAPAVDMNGKTFHQLLRWVSRETGLAFRFNSDAAEKAAQETLTGVEGDEPMATLRVGAAAARLTIEQVDGVILISLRGP